MYLLTKTVELIYQKCWNIDLLLAASLCSAHMFVTGKYECTHADYRCI